MHKWERMNGCVLNRHLLFYTWVQMFFSAFKFLIKHAHHSKCSLITLGEGHALFLNQQQHFAKFMWTSKVNWAQNLSLWQNVLLWGPWIWKNVTLTCMWSNLSLDQRSRQVPSWCSDTITISFQWHSATFLGVNIPLITDNRRYLNDEILEWWNSHHGSNI